MISQTKQIRFSRLKSFVLIVPTIFCASVLTLFLQTALSGDQRTKDEITQTTITFTVPTQGYISSKFGNRLNPFTGKEEFHQGIDIANKEGTEIVTVADGTVIEHGINKIWGKYMTIDHGENIVYRYAKLQKFLVEKGAKVKKGQSIALMGNTGRSTGPHLHFELKMNGQYVDPILYLNSEK